MLESCVERRCVRRCLCARILGSLRKPQILSPAEIQPQKERRKSSYLTYSVTTNALVPFKLYLEIIYDNKFFTHFLKTYACGVDAAVTGGLSL